MLCWKDVAFHHVMKSGGQSIAKVLVDNGKTDFYLGDGRKTYGTDNLQVIEYRGKPWPHAPLSHKLAALGSDKFYSYKIFAGIRNPLDTFISYWAMVMSTGGVHGKRQMSASEYFRYRMDTYYDGQWLDLSIDGDLPSNLTLVRFENFVEEWKKILLSHWELSVEIPHLNATKHGTPDELLSVKEQAVLIEIDRPIVERFYPELL